MCVCVYVCVCVCVCVLQARREYLQKKEEAAEDKKKFAEKVYGERLSDSDHSFFGGGSSEEPLSDDSQKKTQPYTGGWVKEVRWVGKSGGV